MVKKIFTQVKVPCVYYLQGSDVEHCRDCSFFNGTVEENGKLTGVDCLRGEVGSMNAHVTEFTSNGWIYHVEEYDSRIHGKIEGDDPYDFCQKCCFNKILANGNDICLLRCATSDEESSSFMCYEGEIWKKEKLEKI